MFSLVDRHWVARTICWLASLAVAILFSMFGGGTPSATASPAAQVRVGDATSFAQVLVGSRDSIGASQRLGNDPATAPRWLAAGVTEDPAARLLGPGSNYDGMAPFYDTLEPGVDVRTDVHVDEVGRHTTQAPVGRPSGVVSEGSVAVSGFGVAAEGATPAIKAGTAGGETAGKAFPQSVKDAALAENPGTCVYCRMGTSTPRIDHAIPKSRGGNATLDNAQTTCPWCNGSKNNRDFPMNPPPGYEGGWPPPWWSPVE